MMEKNQIQISVFRDLVTADGSSNTVVICVVYSNHTGVEAIV